MGDDLPVLIGAAFSRFGSQVAVGTAGFADGSLGLILSEFFSAVQMLRRTNSLKKSKTVTGEYAVQPDGVRARGCCLRFRILGTGCCSSSFSENMRFSHDNSALC